ncbi:hypothetical protein [Streptomyces sp. SLBN-31]|uniref:hypothetical protein n=1 Tax=Streptomyces sp. SLBN-31 TaxID=2768444 RepID=UPI0011540C66|nr:hypothetical protein [Streptomyces sp. SLBN-31]TQJ89329.1 hypothetical protein FBY22_0088 [Streptomyces sp. SLBN-31]
MSALKRRLDSSLTAQAVLAFLMALAITALFARPDEHPASWLLRSALYTGIGVVFIVVQRRRIGRATGADPRRLADLNRKIRHREVPSDPEERAVMRRLVAEHLRRMERGGRWLPYSLGLMGLLAVGLLVVGAVTGSLSLPVFTVLLIGICCWTLWMRRRTLDRCRHMQSALREQDERVS